MHGRPTGTRFGRKVRRNVLPEAVIQQMRVAGRQQQPALAARHVGGPAVGAQHVRVQRRPRALHTGRL